MPSIKDIRRLQIHGLCCPRVTRVALSFLFLFAVGSAEAESCIAPTRPFLPGDAREALDYEDIIRKDFELYFRDVQGYFRCLEEERTRAFNEAREVTEDYRRFLERVGR